MWRSSSKGKLQNVYERNTVWFCFGKQRIAVQDVLLHLLETRLDSNPELMVKQFRGIDDVGGV